MRRIQDKRIIAIVCVIAIVLVAGAYFLFFAKKTVKKNTQVVSAPQEEVVPTLDPSNIGLVLTESADGKKVTMDINKTDSIVSLDYQLSYTAKGNIPRGIIGHIDVKNSGNPIKQDIVLGTCSDVCHYDQDITDIKLVLNVTKTDGKSYSVEQSL